MLCRTAGTGKAPPHGVQGARARLSTGCWRIAWRRPNRRPSGRARSSDASGSTDASLKWIDGRSDFGSMHSCFCRGSQSDRSPTRQNHSIRSESDTWRENAGCHRLNEVSSSSQSLVGWSEWSDPCGWWSRFAAAQGRRTELRHHHCTSGVLAASMARPSIRARPANTRRYWLTARCHACVTRWSATVSATVSYGKSAPSTRRSSRNRW